MLKTIEPKDVVVLHPDALKRVKVKNEMDKKFIEALEWGYAFHPEQRPKLYVDDSKDSSLEIKWPEESDVASDVLETISVFTVPADLPIAGLAEHLISFRRLLNSQYMDVKNGEHWSSGANVYLKHVMA